MKKYSWIFEYWVFVNNSKTLLQKKKLGVYWKGSEPSSHISKNHRILSYEPPKGYHLGCSVQQLQFDLERSIWLDIDLIKIKIYYCSWRCSSYGRYIRFSGTTQDVIPNNFSFISRDQFGWIFDLVRIEIYYCSWRCNSCGRYSRCGGMFWRCFNLLICGQYE